MIREDKREASKKKEIGKHSFSIPFFFVCITRLREQAELFLPTCVKVGGGGGEIFESCNACEVTIRQL